MRKLNFRIYHGILKKLHEYAKALKDISLWQVASDIDYLLDWITSDLWSKNKPYRLPPTPEGLNTKDTYSHNCPIPFIRDLRFVFNCTNKLAGINALSLISNLLSELKIEYPSRESQDAITEYQNYISKILEILGGEAPVPPEPPVGSSYVYIFGHSNIIASEYDEEEQTITYGDITESLEDFYFRHDKLLARNASIEANLAVVSEGVTYNLGFIDSDFKYYYKDAGIINNSDGTIESIYLPHGTFDKLDLNYLDRVFIFKEGVYGELDNPPEDPTTLRGGYIYLASSDRQQEVGYNDLLEIVVF